jgi:hypothetical protein
MKEKIKFPASAEDVMKNVMFINMRRLFRKWKSELNTNYMKKGLVPKHMGKIIEARWKEFAQQKTDPKALAISNEYAEMSKKNIYPHHMGSRGYVAKIPEWKKLSVWVTLIRLKTLKIEPSTGYSLGQS